MKKIIGWILIVLGGIFTLLAIMSFNDSNDSNDWTATHGGQQAQMQDFYGVTFIVSVIAVIIGIILLNIGKKGNKK
jgi:hypothetical protein